MAQIGGVQLEGTAGALEGRTVGMVGGGDVYFKFYLSQMLHLGIDPKDITVIELEAPPPDLAWQYEDAGVNVVLRKDWEESPDLFDWKKCDFGIVATPPHAHFECAKEIIEAGVPVFVEKTMFPSTGEYDEFVTFCEENNGRVYSVDWQRQLGQLLYATLGQDVPFANAIQYDNQDAFTQLAEDLASSKVEIESISARFHEGWGNSLAALDHRDHLAGAQQIERDDRYTMDKPAATGMLSDMIIHAIDEVTGMGGTLVKVEDTFLGGPSDEEGYRQQIPRYAEGGNAPEMFARVKTVMEFDGKEIPVIFEGGKGPEPNLNDARTIITLSDGRELVHEFGHRLNKVELFKDGEVVAKAIDRGEPYERMLIEGDALFRNMPKDQPFIAYGPESKEGIRIVEKAHHYVMEHPFDEAAPGTMKQLVLEEGVRGPETTIPDGLPVHIVGHEDYTIISPEVVVKDSAQGHSTAEGVTVDGKTGCVYIVDIEHGMLFQHHPENEELRNSWKLTSDERDKDGRPMQMLSLAGINQDGNIMVALSGGGRNAVDDLAHVGQDAGLHYFDPVKEELHFIGKMPEYEKNHPDHRFNDETKLKITDPRDGEEKTVSMLSSMSRHWDKTFDDKGNYERTGAYHLLDPDTLELRRVKIEKSENIGEDIPYDRPLITNGLADGGTTADGKKIVFWAETGQDIDNRDQLNIYRGVLDLEALKTEGADLKITDAEIFKTHEQMGGFMNGADAFVRPDGACIGKFEDKDVYGISLLELGEIRFYYNNPEGKEDGGPDKEEAVRIKLPPGFTRVTRFGLSENAQGETILTASSTDPAHFQRRPNAGDRSKKTPDGMNGTAIETVLPRNLKLTPHEDAVGRVDCPPLTLDQEIDAIVDAAWKKSAQDLADKPPATVSLKGVDAVRTVDAYHKAREGGRLGFAV